MVWCGRTRSGDRMPLSRIEATRPASFSGSKTRRGWYRPGWTSSIGTIRVACRPSASGGPLSPSRADSPMPRLVRRFGPVTREVQPLHATSLRLVALAMEHFPGEMEIGRRTGTAPIVEKHGFAVARRLGNLDVARDDRVVDLRTEIAAHVGGDEIAEI